MNNVLIVVQARANSKRLPNKIWADLHGKPMLQHVLERARHIGPEVFVATPPPGLDENDVLGRFKLVSEYYPDVEHFVRLTADCPLLDVGVAKRILEEHLRGGSEVDAMLPAVVFLLRVVPQHAFQREME